MKTQANKTKKSLDEAAKIVLQTVKGNRNPAFLQLRLAEAFKPISDDSMKIVSDLAHYEAKYTADKLKKYSNNDVNSLTKAQVDGIIPEIKVKTSTTSTPLTIKDTYKKFADIKIKQYSQLLSDIDVEDLGEEDAIQQVKEKTNGLFSTQNLALATLAILGTANSIRNQVAKENNMLVEWTLDLELNNCSYCEDMAAGGPYKPEDVESEIPVHVNCGCSLVPVEDPDNEE